MCLNNDPSTFFLTKDNYKILGRDRVDWDKCALFIVNINRDFSAVNSYIENPNLSDATIYCGACMPSYRSSR